MPSSLSLNTLIRLQKRQFSRRNFKKEQAGLIFLVVYFWMIEILFILLYKGKAESIPPLVVTAMCLGLLLMNFVFKLIFVRDQTVMDAFLKTRPVPQALWNRFLWVSQFWKISNLTMPVATLPMFLLLIPFPRGLAVWLAIYLFSVLGGILVMLLKRRGTYASEKAVSTTTVRAVKSGRSGNAIFGLQSKSLFRSKRMRTAMLYFAIFGLFEFVVSGLEGKDRFDSFWLFFFIVYPVVSHTQYGFGVESTVFSGIWTRPIPVMRLLSDKFRLSAVLALLAFLIVIPFCLWIKCSLLLPASYALYAAGFASPLMLIDAYRATPFDLFGKSFFNYQGTKGTFKASTFLGSLLIIGLGAGLGVVCPGWPSYLILSGLGLLGIIFHRPYFAWVERKFLRNKYKYMDIYQSR